MKQVFTRHATVAAAVIVYLLYCAVLMLRQGLVPAGPLERKSREEVLCAKQLGSALDNNSLIYSSPPARFLLYRLIGNDMPPLQRPGQLLWNTVYALEHEAQFHDCEKRWVLNKIVNQTMKAALLEVLNKHGYGSQDIVDIKIGVLKLKGANTTTWERSVITQNAGRNAAIEDGVRAGSRWLLIFDGNQFLTDEGWQGIVASADRAEKRGLKYFKVPMYRLTKIQDPSWLNNSAVYASLRDNVPVKGESQIAIRGDALARFDEGEAAQPK
jgi:hypothetical protein